MNKYQISVSTTRNQQIAYADDMAQAERRAQNILSRIGDGGLACIYDNTKPLGEQLVKTLKYDSSHVPSDRVVRRDGKTRTRCHNPRDCGDPSCTGDCGY